jgi:large subunit ribosomal protein L29|uniref:Large ribosomal subunit protein uL29 n=1 Tax=candidate division WOR-3 bacterium TaxID=2052148 RepID=A0A7C3UW06_UNCW3
MKPSELRNMSDAELLKTYRELQEEYFNLRLRKVMETLPNPLKLRTLRRDCARILTILRERGYTKEQVKRWERTSEKK